MRVRLRQVGSGLLLELRDANGATFKTRPIEFSRDKKLKRREVLAVGLRIKQSSYLSKNYLTTSNASFKCFEFRLLTNHVRYELAPINIFLFHRNHVEVGLQILLLHLHRRRQHQNHQIHGRTAAARTGPSRSASSFRKW